MCHSVKLQKGTWADYLAVGETVAPGRVTRADPVLPGSSPVVTGLRSAPVGAAIRPADVLTARSRGGPADRAS